MIQIINNDKTLYQQYREEHNPIKKEELKQDIKFKIGITTEEHLLKIAYEELHNINNRNMLNNTIGSNLLKQHNIKPF